MMHGSKSVRGVAVASGEVWELVAVYSCVHIEKTFISFRVLFVMEVRAIITHVPNEISVRVIIVNYSSIVSTVTISEPCRVFGNVKV